MESSSDLDFALSALFNGMDESLKYPQKRRKSFSESFSIAKVSRDRQYKKKKKVRRQSQCTEIYPSLSESSTNIGSCIIDDYIQPPTYSNNFALRSKMDCVKTRTDEIIKSKTMRP